MSGHAGGAGDLALYLAGTWRLQRRIADARTGMTGRMRGRAEFSAAPDGLHYEERGLLALGAHRGEATQRYRFSTEGWRATVRFADGSPFHTLDLATGRAESAHDCAPDQYRGRYRLLGRDGWMLAWAVRGPRKSLRIVTLYRRSQTSER